MKTKTQLLVRRGEAVAAAAQDQLSVMESGEPLALSGLPAAAKATESVARAQALVYERWAADVMPDDPLLGRAVAELARAFGAIAEQARGVRREAVDALASIAEEGG